MTTLPTYVAAPPGELYWRYEVCPHGGAKVLLKTIGGTCTVGAWQGAYGFAFVAWCPMPKDGTPAADIRKAPLRERLKFALKLIFQPPRKRAPTP